MRQTLNTRFSCTVGNVNVSGERSADWRKPETFIGNDWTVSATTCMGERIEGRAPNEETARALAEDIGQAVSDWNDRYRALVDELKERRAELAYRSYVRAEVA